MTTLSPPTDHISLLESTSLLVPLQEVGDKGGREGFLHGFLQASSGGTLIPSTSSPLHYSWTSLVAQTVKNLSAMWETWVRSLGWEIP